MPKLDPEALMRLAVEEMHRSVPERREDGKTSPLVGAVLWLPDGTVEAAHRSEFRDGDHAEYTILERKLRATKLDQGVLFTTLEPCLKRGPLRTACAVRIGASRIRQVWVGMEDPDPTVEGRGREYLLGLGVDVQRFPEELFREIEAANAEFIKQALARSVVAHTVPPTAISLSTFEHVEPRVAVDGFSPDALERYRQTADIGDPVDSPAFLAHLAHLGLLHVDDRGRFQPTKYGVVALGRDPQALYPMTTVLGRIRPAEGLQETRSFQGPGILLPDQVLAWLRDRLPQPLDRSRGASVVVDALPYDAVREAIVNAITHRDYEPLYEGVQTSVEVTPDLVIVKSAGEPKAPSSLAKLQELTAVPVARNPTLQATFARARLAEGQNYGMETFRGLVDLGLPRPTFSYDEPYLTLTIYRTPVSAVAALGADVLAQLTTDERRGWELISKRGSVSRAEYGASMGFDSRKANRHLSHFVALGLLERQGAGRSIRYRLATS
jgi:ATP-dependent DNA helicase RecG